LFGEIILYICCVTFLLYRGNLDSTGRTQVRNPKILCTLRRKQNLSNQAEEHAILTNYLEHSCEPRDCHTSRRMTSTLLEGFYTTTKLLLLILLKHNYLGMFLILCKPLSNPRGILCENRCWHKWSRLCFRNSGTLRGFKKALPLQEALLLQESSTTPGKLCCSRNTKLN
jgi:hypothetical protein